MDIIEKVEKPEGWPKNRREWKLDVLCEKMKVFEDNPTYKNKEVLIALVSEHDLNETSGIWLIRITEYEVVLINHLYWASTMYQINSVKTYLYDLISEATYLHKFKSDLSQNHSEEQFVEAYRGLELPLKLYYLAYHKYIRRLRNA